MKVNLVPLTSPNRIPFLLTNKVDLIVATFGITPERAKQVMFSIPYSAIENVVFAPQGQEDRQPRRPEGPARRRAARHGAGRDPEPRRWASAVKLSRFDDDPSTYQALLTGQVDAIAETG